MKPLRFRISGLALPGICAECSRLIRRAVGALHASRSCSSLSKSQDERNQKMKARSFKFIGGALLLLALTALMVKSLASAGISPAIAHQSPLATPSKASPPVAQSPLSTPTPQSAPVCDVPWPTPPALACPWLPTPTPQPAPSFPMATPWTPPAPPSQTPTPLPLIAAAGNPGGVLV